MTERPARSARREVQLAGDDLFRKLLESAPDAMVIVDQRGDIVLVNSQTERLFGFPRAELLGHPVEILIPGRLAAAHRRHREGFVAEPHVRAMGQGLDLQGVRRDGTEFSVEISLSPLDSEHGRFVCAAIRDVTERKRVERTLQEKNVELEKASQAKDRFLASMSHELRTPLNAIIGFTGTMLMGLPGPLNSVQEDHLTTIRTSGRHLLSLINDLLDLAKIESGKVELQFEPVDLRSVIDEVAASLRPLAVERGLSLDIEAPAEAVLCHSARRPLGQILINLVGNAIKFTSHGRVVIRLTRPSDAGEVEIVVEDSGRGIGHADLARLFDAFAQMDSSPEPLVEGSGLGLHLSRKLAHLLGARILVDSVRGQGSTFRVVMRGQ